MPATSPEALHQAWVDGVNRRDLEGLVSLYEVEAAFATEPGRVVVGLDAIRAACAALLAVQPTATLEILTVVRLADLALLVSRWHLTGSGPDGAPVEVGGQTSDVARRQADGTWRFAIDNPWGDRVVGA
jgi:uncharacterized protein (TIGR02246 family)